MIETIAIHRGRNSKASAILKSVTKIDYNFDFRGFYRGSRINLLWLLLKAWITSKEIPEAQNYILEGGLLFWVSYFLKKRYPQSKLIVMAIEPAFYLDPKKGKLQKWFFKMRMKAMKNQVDHFIFISHLVKDSARQWMGEVPHSLLPFYINEVEKLERLVTCSHNKNLLFAVERPADAGYVKGLDIAVEIFQKLSEKRKDVTLFITGSGTEHLEFDNPNIKPLGFTDIQKVFQETSICIAPARFDAFPLIIAETSMHGIIPLISQYVGTKEILEKVDTKLVLDHRNVDQWVERIEYYLDSSSKTRDELFEKLKSHFKLLTKEQVLMNFQKICEQVLKTSD